MMKLPYGAPTESELQTRIVQHMSWRNTDATALLWLGYISCLLEWGLITVDCHARLVDLLPNVGTKELLEMMYNAPLSADQEAEIDQKKS